MCLCDVCVLLLFWRDSFFMIFLISAYPMIRILTAFVSDYFLKYVYIVISLGKKRLCYPLGQRLYRFAFSLF